jgi:Terminase small subunit
MPSLSYRERLFVESYLGESSGSAVDAARRARYPRPEKLGPRVVKKGRVQAAIDAGVQTAGTTSNEVLARLADVATVDILDFMRIRRDGQVKADLELVKRLGLGHLVKRLRINKDGTPDIELEPKVPALVKLGEHYELWKGKAEPQITLVELAKRLRDRYEQLQSEGQYDEPPEALP